jgi:hypothetical protein
MYFAVFFEWEVWEKPISKKRLNITPYELFSLTYLCPVMPTFSSSVSDGSVHVGHCHPAIEWGKRTALSPHRSLKAQKSLFKHNQTPHSRRDGLLSRFWRESHCQMFLVREKVCAGLKRDGITLSLP